MSEAAFYSSPAWLALRYQALKAQNRSCSCCGDVGNADNPLQVDHIKPRSTHPDLALSLSNLQVLCRRCNLGKGNKDTIRWNVEPSQELLIIASAEPADRARLQQLNWLRLNGDSEQMRHEADRKYRNLRRKVVEAWQNAQGKPL